MSTEPRDLILLTKAEHVWAEARTIDEVEAIQDKAQAAQVHATKIGLSTETTRHAPAIKVRLERRFNDTLYSPPLADFAPTVGRSSPSGNASPLAAPTRSGDTTAAPRGPPPALAALRVSTLTKPHYEET